MRSRVREAVLEWAGEGTVGRHVKDGGGGGGGGRKLPAGAGPGPGMKPRPTPSTQLRLRGAPPGQHPRNPCHDAHAQGGSPRRRKVRVELGGQEPYFGGALWVMRGVSTGAGWEGGYLPEHMAVRLLPPA